MDASRAINVLVFLAILIRASWWAHDFLQAHLDLDQKARQKEKEGSAHDAPAGGLHETRPSRSVSQYLRRCNESVIDALLGDAAAAGTQHRYLQSGFAVSSPAMLKNGLAFQDLAAALQVVPAATVEQIIEDSSEGDLDKFTMEPVRGTKYGDHLLMTLRLLLPGNGKLGILDFSAFQRAWHQWQLGVRPEDRGTAATIALKNLERGLEGRQAATLVGDIGATPRLPVLVAVFALDACYDIRRSQANKALQPLLAAGEERLSRAAREITMTTHDRAEALVASEFLARVIFRLVFQDVLLLPTAAEWHPLDRPTVPSVLWRAVRAVRKAMGDIPFLRRVIIDTERLCMRQQRRAPLGGELGGVRQLDPQNDLLDLGMHHTQRLPTPQSDSRQRELFGLSGGLSAALPAVLYLAWKYERHPAAALTANTLLGGNSAGRGVILGALLGARNGGAAQIPAGWFAQLRSRPEVLQALRALNDDRLTGASASKLQYNPCLPSLCSPDRTSSEATTSGDVKIFASAVAGGWMNDGDATQRYVNVQLNVSNAGVTGLPICPHGKLWILWEAGGFARGRFRGVGDGPGIQDVAERCLGPHQWTQFEVNITTGEPEALRPGRQHMVGLLEVLRPLRGPRGRQRLTHPGVGNLVHAVVSRGQPPEACEHFAAKLGRFEIPI